MVQSTNPYGNFMIKNAAGYESIGDVTNREVISTNLKEKTYCESIIAQISMTEMDADFSGIAQCGDTITWIVTPNPVVRRLGNNDVLKHSHAVPCDFSLKIGRQLYSSYKMSEYNYRRACMAPQIMASLLRNSQQEMRRKVDSEALKLMCASAHCFNRGENAGVISQKYNLGTCDNPLCLDRDNIHLYPPILSAVIGEWCAPGDDWFMIVPKQLGIVMKTSPTFNDLLSNCGVCNFPLITGQFPQMVHNMVIIESDLLDCEYCLNGNDRVYPVIFGRRQATAFVSLFNIEREMSDVDDLAKYWQIVMAYGLGVPSPEWLGCSHVKIEAPDLSCTV